jgi:adenine-specific DNA-methyltransferase
MRHEVFMNDGLFSDLVIDTPQTQAIKYTGSKLKLLPYILSLSKKVSDDPSRTIVFDGFSGSTRVSQAYAKMGYTVYANDLAPYSKIFNTAFLLNKSDPKTYQQLIKHLNSLKPMDGWFTEHYGGDGAHKASNNGDGLKKPWQKKNTQKLDAVREEIDKLNLDEITKAVAITSLIFALDQVDSTLGHYASYLNEWSPRSYKDMNLKVPNLWINDNNNVVMNFDVFNALQKLPQNTAIAYFDPPYGSNNDKMPPSRVRYASYYHIWTTICLNDKPSLFGKAKRRNDTSDTIASSVFEEFRKNENGKFIVIEAIEKLIKETNVNYIILSYSSGGRATANELNDVLTSYGKIIGVEKIDYKRNVMSTMKWTNEWVRNSSIDIEKNDIEKSDIEKSDTENGVENYAGEKNYEYLFLLEK